ncbi:MAG: NAD-dependent epimerase/dehydratase family protein [Thermoanaerobaculia bacterium]
MSRYLVTGAAGFIGSKVSDLLLDTGHTVTGLDNLNSAYDVRLKDWRLARLRQRNGFDFVKVDITDRPALSRFFEESQERGGFEGIINLAARAGIRPSVQDPWIYYETNVIGTLNLLDLVVSQGVPKFVLASSSSLYGRHNELPYREDQNTDHPLSPYAASKKAAEEICYTYHYLHGVDVTVLRYFTVYGPAGRPDMSLFRFVQWISEGRPVIVFGDGTQTRDFTYVDDVARGSILALASVGPEPINIGSDRPVSLMELIRLIERLVGKRAAIEYRPTNSVDLPATWAHTGRAREILGWSPATTFEEGVRRLVEWYQENQEWARDIDTSGA